MVAAGLDGPQPRPRGLRHGFGVAAVSAGIPLNLVQKWLRHAQLSTTAIYADAEKQGIASRMRNASKPALDADGVNVRSRSTISDFLHSDQYILARAIANSAATRTSMVLFSAIMTSLVELATTFDLRPRLRV